MYEQKKAEKAMITRLIIAVLLFAIGFGCYKLDVNTIQPKYSEIKTGLQHNTNFAKQIESVNSDREHYVQLLSESGKVYGKIVSQKDSYIAFLGETALANQLEINKMTIGDLLSCGKDLFSLNMQIELVGDLYNIKNMLQELEDSERISRINSVSYRQIQTDKNGKMLSWLLRDVDDETLIEWWSIDTESIVSRYATTSDISADVLLEQSPAICYLDIDFLGSGG